MRTIPLGGKKAAGRVALVDDGDYPLVSQHKWYVREEKRRGRSRGPYAITNVTRDGERTTLFMHNLIMGRTWIDHANGNGLDNQRSNLRSATNIQNMRNRLPNINHSSQYKGVYWQTGRRVWVARIGYGGQRHDLGCFGDEEEAAKAYDAAAQAAFGEFARLNFPVEPPPEHLAVITAGCEAWAPPVTAKRTQDSLTATEEADFVNRYKSGQSVGMIAAAYDLWTATVRRTLRRHGVTMRGTARDSDGRMVAIPLEGTGGPED